MRQVGDVAGVVEAAISFQDISDVLLADVSDARPAGTRDVRAPVGVPEPAGPRLETDTAVDHRNRIGVRDGVEDVGRPWPVDAAEDDVVVQRSAKPGRFADARFVQARREPRCVAARFMTR